MKLTPKLHNAQVVQLANADWDTPCTRQVKEFSIYSENERLAEPDWR